MQMKVIIKKKIKHSPLLSKKERILALERVRGIWKNKKSDPIKELKRIRKEWERE